MSQERSLARSNSIIGTSFSADTALAAASALLAGLGFEDLQPSILATEQTYQAKTQPLVTALRFYLEHPHNTAYQQQLTVLLSESITDLKSEILRLERQQQKYQREVALESSSKANTSRSYLSQAQSWVLGQLKYFFGSTASQQAEKYAELIASRQVLLENSKALLTVLDSLATAQANSKSGIIESDTAILHSPTSRRLLQTTSLNTECCYSTGRCDVAQLVNGVAGFVLQGEAAGDQAGFRVTRAGDINGDGIADLIMGAFGASPAGRTAAGNTYVVFGTRNTTAWGSGRLDFSSLMNGVRGFALQGEMANDGSGVAVSGVGDMNGDGVDDFALGAWQADPGGRASAGNTYVIFGNRNLTAWGNGRIELASLMNGVRGFVLQGEAASDVSGIRLSGGDVNGDNIGDLILASIYGDSPGRTDAGNTYVIFGSRNTSAWGNGSINLSTLVNGVRGFVLQGEASYDLSGWSVGSVGDINGDGIGDLAVGAPSADPVSRVDAGNTYVIFGSDQTAAWGNGRVDLNTLMNGARGFTLQGEASGDKSGWVVGKAGDINGDGISDLVIGAYYADPAGRINAGASYVVFGNSTAGAWNTGRLNLTSIADGRRGFVLQGEIAGDVSGVAVGGAVDLNNDGIDDLLVGALTNNSIIASITSNTYVIFGSRQSSAWENGHVELANVVDGQRGLFLQGEADPRINWASDLNGAWVDAVGDLNGDGISDIARGVRYANPAGRIQAGSSYIFFGYNASSFTTFGSNSSCLSSFSGPEFRVNTYTTNIQKYSRSAFLASGDFVVVWQSYGQDGSGYGVFAQQFSSIGVPKGSEFRVNSYTQDDQLGGDITGLSSGGFVVVWSSYGQDGSMNGVYGRLYLSTGSPQGSEFQINTYTSTNQWYPSVTHLLSGDFVVVWTSAGQDGSGDGIYGQRYSVNGIRQGNEFRVNTYTANDQNVPSLVGLKSGEFIVTWQSRLGQDGSLDGSYAQRYSATGVAQGTEFHVNTYTTNNQNGPSVAALSSGEFIIAWRSEQDESGYGVYAQRYSATAASQGTEFRVNNYVTNNQWWSEPARSVIAVEGGFVVVWESNGQDGDGNGIYARRFSSTGSPLGTEFRVNSYTINEQVVASVSSLGVGSFFVSWQSSGQDGSSTGVYGQIIRWNVAAPSLLNNQLALNDNETLAIMPSHLNATDVDIDQDATYTRYLISNLQQGIFELVFAPGTAISNFTQSQINSNQVRFVHSGSNIAPSYQVTVTDGELSTPAQWSTISFNRRPVIVQNRLAINQGQRLTLTASELTVSDDQLPGQLLYLVSNALQGQFELTTAVGTPIAQFTQAQVNGGTIQFVQDNSALAPSYQLRVSDSVLNSTLSTANVTFYRRPQWLTLPAFSLAEGDTMVVSTGVINVLEDYPDPQVWFNITALQYGQFNLVSPVATNISQFNFEQLKTGRVRFQHDASEFAPSYDLTLFDPYFSLPSVSSNITFISVNDPPVLLQNYLSILQGQTITFNTSNLLTIDPDNSEDDLIYYASNIQRGVFFSSTPLSPLYSFTQSNISRGEIQFIHDGSVFPPYYQVTVIDGELSTPLQTVIVTFNGVNHPPLLLTAVLSVSEGQSVVLTPSQFSASDIDTPTEQVIFLISNITHGRFELYSIPGVVLDHFSMQDIQQNTIRFVHDGSEEAPTFIVAVTDGVSTTALRPAIVSYTPVNNVPVLVNNTLVLSEGSTVALNSAFLSATDRDNPAGSLLFLPSQVQQGRFELVSNTGRPLTSFSQQQVTDGQVRFVHDGGEVAPSYQMAVSDGLLSSPSQAVTVDYTPVNDAPRIVLNQLAIAEGGSAVLSSSQLLIEDPDSSSTQLLIMPSATQAGQFEQVFNPGISLGSFNYQNVQTGFIRFVHNGSEVPAAYTLTVSDGNLSSAPVAAVITYTSVNDAPVLTRNRLMLSEGDTLTLSSDDLAATDSDDAAAGLLFTVSQLQQGRFTDTTTGTSVLSFDQQALDSGQVSFTHDGSQFAPTYFISVSDGRLASPAQSVLVNFTAINDAPSIVVNQLSITQGQTVLLDSGNLQATDEETLDDDLLLTASQVKNGHFEYVADPGRPVSTFSQDKIRKADIRFVSDGSSRAPSYVLEVSDGQLDSAPSTAAINFNPVPATPAPSGLSTQEIVSLLSTLGSVGLTIAGYLWWRNKTAEHRRGHDFANHLRKLLNLEYYDFTKGAGDVYKLKVNNLIQQINSRHDDFYAHLTDEQRQSFALCIAGLMVQKELLARSGKASGLFNWWLCFSVGWSNQLKLKEMDKAATAIGDAAVTAWKAETRPLERWSYKPRGAREKIGMFFAASNCTSSRPQRGMLAEVHRASEYKSRTVEAVEAGEDVELDTLQPSSAMPAGRVGRGSGFFDRSEGVALKRELEAQQRELELQKQQVTAMHEKLDTVLVHLTQPR